MGKVLELGAVGNIELPEGHEVYTEEKGKISSFADGLAVLKVKNQLNDIKKVRQEIVDKALSITDDNDHIIECLQNNIKSIHLEKIKKLTKVEIDKIYMDGDKPIELSLEDVKDEINFKRGYLVYLKESNFALEEIDRAIAGMDETLVEYNSAIESILSEHKSLTQFIESKLKDSYEKAQEPTVKARFKDMMDNFRWSFTLENIHDTLAGLKTANILMDYNDDERSMHIYGKYKKVLKKLSLSSDLAVFDKLEEKHLPEKYHKYPNLFLYSVMRCISYKADKCTNTAEGVFLSQLAANVKALFEDSFDDMEHKQTFIQGIEDVLDLFY